MKSPVKRLLTLIIIFFQLISPALVFSQESTNSAQVIEVASPSASLSPSPNTSTVLLNEIVLDNTQSQIATNSVQLNIFKNPQEAFLSAKVKVESTVRSLRKRHFRSDEKVVIVVDNATLKEVKVSLFDKSNQELPIDIEEISDEEPVVLQINPPLSFKPGKYKLKITDAEGEVTIQEFTWGVLAVNTNKSIYLPNETAKLAFAVLDEDGNMVCDASVKLEIRNPKSETEVLSTDNSKIKVNPECRIKDYVTKPDYEAEYLVSGVGVYQMTLSAFTKNGNFTITDSFEVREAVAFDIERILATRIYPPKNYPVLLEVKANEDFEGIVTEVVPPGFDILPYSPIGGSPDAGSIKSFDSLSVENQSLFEEEGFGISSKLDLPFDEKSLQATASALLSAGFGVQIKDPVLAKKYSDYGLLGHDGADFDLPSGTPVLAADEGEVVLAKENSDYGTTVVLKHKWGKSYYGHLSKISKSLGQKVSKGEEIAMSGQSGLSTGPHLHFGVKPNKNDPNNGYFGKINPLPYFNLGENDPVLVSPATPRDPVKVLSWNINIKKGEKIILGYIFKAPNESPEFYKLGPLQFNKYQDGEIELVFQEARHWQIAADVAWYDSAWLYRKKVTIDNTKVSGSSDFTNFPVLVNLSSDTDLSADAQSDGDDILFTSSDAMTKLPHEIERYTSGTGELVAWVNVTTLGATADTVLYMYYGNSTVASQQNATGTWNSNYVGVWHLKDGTTLSAADSTTVNNGTITGSTATTGQIDGGANFSGTNQNINFGTLSSVDNIFASSPNTGTVSFWIKRGATGFMTIFGKQTDSPSSDGWWVVFRAAGGSHKFRLNHAWSTANGIWDSTTQFSSTTTWYHLVVTYNGSSTTNDPSIYVNGTAETVTEDTTPSGTITLDGTRNLKAGESDDGFNDFNGILDEIRLTNDIKSADWVKTEYDNQNSPSTFYTLASEEAWVSTVTNDKLMRHGKWFSAGVEQPFTF